MKVAFQGAPGAFSHRAAQLFAQQMEESTVEAVSCQTFEETFSKVLSRDVDFAAIPLENSSVGTIIPNYDLLSKSSVSILSEVYVPVHHNVLGIEGCTLEQLKEVYSHPVALDQCRKFLAAIPGARAVAHWDTSGSAFHIKELNDPSVAAIASEFAAKETGLKIIKRNVEDHEGNRTRFGIIAPESAAMAPTKSQKCAFDLINHLDRFKVTCTVELAHEPGSLARLLGGLAECGADLTKIESRPIPETPWHYKFFLDMQIDREQEPRMLSQLEKHTISKKILGRYPIWINLE